MLWLPILAKDKKQPKPEDDRLVKSGGGLLIDGVVDLVAARPWV